MRDVYLTGLVLRPALEPEHPSLAKLSLSLSGTRNQEMLLTEQVLISATGRLEGECSKWYVSDGCLVRVPVLTRSFRCECSG
ncbi:hypothetical protein DPMN_113137 [Dreissena polymorpha]|uniref:Uncharacterized protein n=1 Tax=Dreissena polymorpha TaxID=45954 RepID=A0A9D4KHX1_DREPO|nr:hypothetical protein DPMN_113137 [Dreissena polymorpha]